LVYMEAETLAFITNIPAPYRTAFFNSLANVVASFGIALHVTYLAESEPNRRWVYDPSEHKYSHSILPGIHLDLRGKYFHLNPRICSEMRAVDPRWLIVGGAWHLPTTLLAVSPGFCPRASRILWSEGHEDAVLHRTGAIAATRRAIYRRFDAFAVPNRRSADFALAQAGRDVPILPLANTINEEYFRRPTQDPRQSERLRLGIPLDARVLVSVCQMVDRKSVVELARAFHESSTNDCDHRILCFIGDGNRSAEVESIAKSCSFGEIRTLGHVAQDHVRSWLWAADGFILATQNDPNPLSPIEASFADLPLILSSKAGNVDELMIDGRTGWRLDSLDPRSIREALGEFYSASRDDLRRMGREAGLNAASSFTRRAVAEGFVASLLDRFPRQKRPACDDRAEPPCWLIAS
jgi:glycosyltransferase involved in cell wall biosynthesis